MSRKRNGTWEALVWAPPSGDKEKDELARFTASLILFFLPPHILTGLYLLPHWIAPGAPTSTHVFEGALILSIASIIGFLLNRRGQQKLGVLIMFCTAELSLIWAAQDEASILVMQVGVMLAAAPVLPARATLALGLTGLAAHPAIFYFGEARVGELLLPAALNIIFLSLGVAVRLHYLRRERIHLEELSERKQWFSTTLSSIGDAVLTVDPLDQVTFMNPVAADLIGMNAQAAQGLAVDEVFRLVTGDTQEPFPCSISGGLPEEGAKDLDRDIELLSHDGTKRRITRSCAPIISEDGVVQGAVLVFRDVSEQRERESQALHSQRLDALGSLAGGVAHDFNNLLTVIGGAAEIATRSIPEDHKARRELAAISDTTRRAVDLTGRLLAFSRRQVLQMQTVSLSDSVRKMERLLARLLREDIHLMSELDPNDDDWVKVDPVQLEQVVLNLILNARDAMPSGGTIRLSSTEILVSEDAPLRTLLPGRYHRLRIVDTGEGMSPETQKRIFEPFFTTKSREQGTGLGLATVYGIVQQSAGKVYVKSSLGKGTSFELYFPAAPPPVELRKETPPAPVAKQAPVDTRLLLVEDDERVRALALRVLNDAGYEVLEAANGRKALELLADQKESVHALITDIVMPEVGGGELAQKARQLYPTLRVLFMSGYADELTAEKGINPSKEQFLAKPFTPSQLLDAIATTLEIPSGKL